MTSVVIAAHNEATVIGRLLEALTEGPQAPGADVDGADGAGGGSRLEIVVAANGCTDDTAGVAAGYDGVQVVEVPAPGKTGALNAADAVATTFPRVYLDADIRLTAADVRRLCAALRPDVPVAVPRREVVLQGRPWPVRGYFAVNTRLPAFRKGLFGRGAIAMSEAGRSRFGAFPDVIADDLFMDSQFTDDEKVAVDDVVSYVEAPRRTRDLYRRLVRVRRGNALLRADDAGTIRPARQLDWLTQVVVPDPRLFPAAVVYVVMTLAATLGARRGDGGWGRDESTR